MYQEYLVNNEYFVPPRVFWCNMVIEKDYRPKYVGKLGDIMGWYKDIPVRIAEIK